MQQWTEISKAPLKGLLTLYVLAKEHHARYEAEEEIGF